MPTQEGSSSLVGAHPLPQNVSRMEESLPMRTLMTLTERPEPKFTRCCKSGRRRLEQLSSKLSETFRTQISRLQKMSSSCASWTQLPQTTTFRSFSVASVKSKPAKSFETKSAEIQCSMPSLNSKTRNLAKMLILKWIMCWSMIDAFTWISRSPFPKLSGEVRAITQFTTKPIDRSRTELQSGTNLDVPRESREVVVLVEIRASQEVLPEVSKLEAHINRIDQQPIRQGHQGKNGTPTTDTMNKIITPTIGKTKMTGGAQEVPDVEHRLENRDFHQTKDLETVPEGRATETDVTGTITRREIKARRNLIGIVGPAQAPNLQIRRTIKGRRIRVEVTRKIDVTVARPIPTRPTTGKESQEDKDFKFSFITIPKQLVPVKI